MKRIELAKAELAIEKDLLRGKYVQADPVTVRTVARAIASRRKDAVLNIRMNSRDLSNLKLKAKKLGVPYQTFISEILHNYAQ